MSKCQWPSFGQTSTVLPPLRPPSPRRKAHQTSRDYSSISYKYHNIITHLGPVYESSLVRLKMKFKCILLLVTLLLALKVKASLDTSKRRCILHDDNSPLIELSATCDSCRSLPPAEKYLPLAMIILASDEPEKSPLLAVASRLVATRMRVVIVRVFGSSGERDNNEQDIEPILRNKITSSIPCDVTPLVSFKWVKVKGVNGSIAMDESPYDAVDKAEAEYQVLEFLVETDELPSVMVVRYFFLYIQSPCVS